VAEAAVKLCFVCCEYPPSRHGGIGSVTQVLARAFAAAGHEVRTVGLYPGLDAAAPVENDRGVAVWRLPMPRGRFGWTQGRRNLFRTVSGWAQRGEVDLVEVPDWEGYAAGWPQLRAPVVTRLHGSSSYFAREMSSRLHWPAYCLEAASFHRADSCCSTSGYTAARTQKLFGRRLKPVDVLFNPVDVPALPASKRSPNRVVFAGTLTAKKGVVPLVEAWPAVLEACPSAEMHLFGKDAGADDGRPMIEALTALLPDQTRDSVRFHGHVDRERVQQEFASCRLAVFPSFAEAFSMVPLEAMAHGCPVIYSDRCSGPELIDSGRDGVLIDPSRPDRIAEAIVSLLRDDAACARLGAAGRSTVLQRFSTSVLLARNERFYGDCISRHV
jgi:glycosyltransferase involved in cell wall biosynthesis